MNLPAALQDLRVKLKAWNLDTFGNIFRRRRRNKLRLEGVQRAMARRSSNSLLYLERELKKERNLILYKKR